MKVVQKYYLIEKLVIC